MRTNFVKLLAILLLSVFTQVKVQAQGVYQSPEEQQRIREMRLLEWYAIEQQRGGQQEYVEESDGQNISYNEPYQEQVSAPIAPEREDLFNAASSGNISQIRKLLSQGLDINVSNNERETALHMAAARGHFETVRFLVGNGAYVNAPTVKRWIPLHHAVRFRHANIVNFLIERGSPAYARTSDGLTAVNMASNNKDYRILSILGER